MRTLLLLAACATMLASCATSSDVPAATAGQLDSTFRAAGLPPGRVKFKGPVVIQLGGTNNTASATSITKPRGSVALATAPGASASATTRTGVPTWALVVGGLLIFLLLVASLVYKFRQRLFSLVKIP
jgi:hypothetical protein